MFTALIFVGIITLTTCRPETQSLIQQQEQQTTDKPNVLQNCTDLLPKQQFNATAYFRDEWYVVRTFIPVMPGKREDETRCVKFTSQILENGSVKQQYTEFSGKYELHKEWLTNLDEFQKNGVGKFESQLLDKEGNPSKPYYPIWTTVIDTDYSNYAVEQKCVSSVYTFLNVYIILNRKPYTLDPNVEPILNKLELKLQDFTAMSKPDCAEAS